MKKLSQWIWNNNDEGQLYRLVILSAIVNLTFLAITYLFGLLLK